MAYKIVHGEMGYDILQDGRIHSIGYGTREAARTAIRETEKAAQALESARLVLRKFCDGQEEDGLTREALIEILGQEIDFRIGPKIA